MSKLVKFTKSSVTKEIIWGVGGIQLYAKEVLTLINNNYAILVLHEVQFKLNCTALKKMFPYVYTFVDLIMKGLTCRYRTGVLNTMYLGHLVTQ